jgi:hypothetical protein
MYVFILVDPLLLLSTPLLVPEFMLYQKLNLYLYLAKLPPSAYFSNFDGH